MVKLVTIKTKHNLQIGTAQNSSCLNRSREFYMEQDNGTKQKISYQAVDPENKTGDSFKLHDDLRTLAKFVLRY